MKANASLVVDGIYRLSANAYNLLFEGMWPIPNGVAMHSYIVKGDTSIAIVDGVCGWDGIPENLYRQLDELHINIEDIEYVIINHFEPDHSGWIQTFKEMRKTPFKIVCSSQGSELLEAFYHIPKSEAIVIKDGDSIDLGNRQLIFATIPNVHWPDTMATFDAQTGTLMPCDAFGSFGAMNERTNGYDDNMTDAEIDALFLDTDRYYSNIVAIFSPMVAKALEKTDKLIGLSNIKIIAPGHGIVWRKDPLRVVNKFVELVGYQTGPAREKITVLWGSMYGMTESAVQPLLDGIKSENVEVEVFNVPEAHTGDILASIWTSSGIAIGMPTYEFKMFPPMFTIIDELFKKKVLNRKAFRFGSYGWSGGAQTELNELIEKHKPNWDFIEPVEFRGSPREADLALVKQRGQELAQSVKKWIANA